MVEAFAAVVVVVVVDVVVEVEVEAVEDVSLEGPSKACEKGVVRGVKQKRERLERESGSTSGT